MQVIHEKIFNYTLAISLLFWSFFFIILKGYQNNEIFTTSLKFLLEAFIIFTAWKLYYSSEQKLKKYFLFFFLSYVAIFFTDLNFVIVFYFLQITTPTNHLNILYLFPFFLYLIFQTSFWFSIAIKHIFKGGVNFEILSLFSCLILTAMIVFFISSSWKINYFSYVGIFQIFSGALELVVFSTVILALICSNDKGCYLLACSTIILIAANFWEMYLFQNQTLQIADYSDSFWFLSLILMAFGLWHIVKKSNIELSSWFRSLKNIKSQVTLWTFSLAILSFS